MPAKIYGKNFLLRETTTFVARQEVLGITISLFVFLPARLIEPALINKDRQLSRYFFMETHGGIDLIGRLIFREHMRMLIDARSYSFRYSFCEDADQALLAPMEQ